MDGLYQSRIYQNYRSILINFIDLLIVFLCYGFAFLLNNGFFLTQGILHFTPYIILGMFFVLLLHLFAQLLFRTHKSLWTYIGTNEVIRSFLASLFCTVIMVGFSWYFHLFHVSIIFVAEILSFLISMGIRLIYRQLKNYAMQSDRKKNALIVGAGNAGYLMLNEIYRNNRYPYNVVGFLDDYKTKGTIISGKQVLGSIEEVGTIAKENGVEQLFIAVQSASIEEKRRIIDLCTSTSINTKIMRFALENDGQDTAIQIEDIEIEDLLNRPSVDLQIDEIGSYLNDQVVCVTGAGGSIGSELCRQIIQYEPKQLVLIDINENNLYMLEQEFNRNARKQKKELKTEIVSLIVSIREREEMDKVIAKYKPSVVYHAAAHKHVPLMETRPSEAILNNVFGTKNVIDACIKNNVSRFILISTDKAVNPTNVMGATKRMTELVLQSREKTGNTKLAAVRFGNVLGSNGSVIPIFKEQIKEGGPVTITDKRVERYFMTIPEAAQLVLQAGYYADQQEIFVLDMGEPVKILKLAENMIRLSGLVPYEDIDIEEIGLRPGEKMYEELTLEIEKCHKTKNDLIFVHEPIHIKQETIDSRLDTLKEVAINSVSNEDMKSILLSSIEI